VPHRLLAPGPSTSAPAQAPKIPSTKQLLPKARALEELAELVPGKQLAGQLYDHWLRRRQQHGGPLLERLWFEVRRAFVRAACVRACVRAYVRACVRVRVHVCAFMCLRAVCNTATSRQELRHLRRPALALT
jgi:hypothetical protein